ncbi:hypothetical protein WMY93_020133 [Mugilogobius chulae]|uniref:Protein kinase domain-containing protein n=1 Tax=Mugilogobius chulae TaxID=88201 RepID=A0AAW0NG84_9GOBI
MRFCCKEKSHRRTYTNHHRQYPLNQPRHHQSHHPDNHHHSNHHPNHHPKHQHDNHHPNHQANNQHPNHQANNHHDNHHRDNRQTNQHRNSNHHRQHQDRHNSPHRSNRHRSHLQGIDAPPGINPLEHEEVPMTVQNSPRTNAKPNAAPRTATERQHRAFSQVTALPKTFLLKPNESVSLYLARMDNKDVVLRAIKDPVTEEEKQQFVGFASFLSRLGPHPFIPALLGVVTVQPPIMMVVEELQHRDLLHFLWKCRQDNAEPGCDMTEKRIYTMSRQVASALDYLHSQQCVHGNIGARSVLVGRDLTVKLWGLGSAYRRSQNAAAGTMSSIESMELKKWQAPEVLARNGVTKNSDVWSFGILLYEMVTLGDAPFPELLATELLQYLQRGKFMKKPANCSNTLYTLIKSCCQWSPQQRVSVPELIRKLESGERSANGSTVLRIPEPLDVGRYLREAGYGEAYNYAVF